MSLIHPLVSHEPECPYKDGEHPLVKMFINDIEIRGCIWCERTRDAYQRETWDKAGFYRWLAEIEKAAYLRGRVDEFNTYASQGMDTK